MGVTYEERCSKESIIQEKVSADTGLERPKAPGRTAAVKLTEQSSVSQRRPCTINDNWVCECVCVCVCVCVLRHGRNLATILPTGLEGNQSSLFIHESPLDLMEQASK